MNFNCPHCGHNNRFIDPTSLSNTSCESCNRLLIAPEFLTIIEQVSADRPGGQSLGVPISTDRFDFVEQIGRGASSVVWKAHDRLLGRLVAIKFFPEGEQGLVSADSRPVREARAAALCSDWRIVSVFDVLPIAGVPSIVAEYIDGPTLGIWRTRKDRPLNERIRLFAEIAEVVHHIHEAGLVHRDLKPHNIIVDGLGHPHIVDLGLALARRREITKNATATVIGTPTYMAPELAKGLGNVADRRADVYSLGVILFELLTNALPFQGAVESLLHDVVRREAPSPRQFVDDIPSELETICLNCLQKNPQMRFSSAQTLAEVLYRFLGTTSSEVSAARNAIDAAVRSVLRSELRKRRRIEAKLGRLAANLEKRVGNRTRQLLRSISELRMAKEQVDDANSELQIANEGLARVNQRMKGDLQAAAAVQRSLLPAGKPGNNRLETAWTYRPCDELAGDSLSVVRIDDNRCAVFLFDVSGHGVRASLRSVSVMHLLLPSRDGSSLLFEGENATKRHEMGSPAAVVNRLNRYFGLRDDDEMFFTMVYGVIDTSNGVFTYVNAGHPGPLHVRQDRIVQTLASTGIPVGFDSRTTYREAHCRLERGDRLVIFSDGLFEEQRDQNGMSEQFGIDRVESIVQNGSNQPLPRLLTSLEDAVIKWSPDGHLRDDLSILAVELL